MIKQLWSDLIANTASCPPDPDAAERWFDQLAAAYRRPDRHYHNLGHVQSILSLMPVVRDELGKQTALSAFQWAAWFHDVVYDPRRNDNEERSAALFDSAAPDLLVPADVADTTRRWIMATKTHESPGDAAAFCDADLAILGSPPDVYDRYRRAIRLEYRWVADQQYRDGRSRVLESFLNRDRIFHTDPMNSRFESAARRNLAHELTDLSAGH
jgi:predicted metal-dependent HD superfamily phosphohydrolase